MTHERVTGPWNWQGKATGRVFLHMESQVKSGLQKPWMYGYWCWISEIHQVKQRIRKEVRGLVWSP